MATAPTLCFLDVDGPLNPWMAKPEKRPAGYTTHRMTPPSLFAQYPGKPRAYVKPLRVWLNPAHGPALLDLGLDLVWATTWMGEARDYIAPVLGLPELPFVDFGAALGSVREDGLHWKTKPLLAYAAERPFIWLDDEISEHDRAYVVAHHSAPALLHWVDPRCGLRTDDFAALAAFAAR
ncbi:HAD domain-containing protein [Streptomyces lasiicapitis]|uniref:HAD domain-containing protein n=1 Tax=Streptomyces lasiicapitis TaxID=1923961 RepID=UPI003332A40C